VPTVLHKVSRGALALWGVVGVGVAAAAVAMWTSETVDLVIGGALIDLGYFVQDPVDPPEHATPEVLWRDLLAHNDLAAGVLWCSRALG
jgi:hypothetical protein